MAKADLAARMQKQVSSPSRTKKQAEPFVAPPQTFARRITLDLTDDDHRALKIAALEAGVNMSHLLRALVSEYREDAKLAKTVTSRAVSVKTDL